MFLELARSRYSVRRYTEQDVEREKIERCVEAARLAPSACNAQPWSFVIVDSPEILDQVAPLTTNTGIPINGFVTNAPVIAALITERPTLSSALGAVVKRTPFHLIDIGIAAEHFCLQAAELGLGTCILGWFNKKAVKKLLGIPKHKELPLLITIGYPEGRGATPKKRKQMAEILSFNRYQR